MKIKGKATPAKQKQMEMLCRHYLESSAMKGHIPAFYYLGMVHEAGIGGDIDKRLAEDWVAQAAAQNDPKAYFKLAQW